MIRLITTTRFDRDHFLKESWLAKSIARRPIPFTLAMSPPSLASVYNVAIEQADPNDVLVFIHDDVRLPEMDVRENLIEVALEQALEKFDVVGVVGSTRRLPGQVYWFSTDGKSWDHGYLSGAVEHKNGVAGYGQAPQEVKLLDGLLLAARASTLQKSGVRFDPRFKFHFYDLDFCRSCEQAGLKMGTWPIIVGHASGGKFGSGPWTEARAAYIEKWRV
jgi:GT2 family glycosyltransferase